MHSWSVIRTSHLPPAQYSQCLVTGQKKLLKAPYMHVVYASDFHVPKTSDLLSSYNHGLQFATHRGTSIRSLWRPWRRSLPALCAETSSAKLTPCPAVTASALPASAMPGSTRGTAKVALPAPSVRRRLAKCCVTPALLMQTEDGRPWLSRPA